MNKDVIYIEPEDDITDIINKIESSKEKIVALVPPKKAAILRSIVNIKLIAKSGKNTAKSIVLVTTDPSILKLAASAKLPVTEDLQTAPKIPKLDEIEPVEDELVEELIEKTDKEGNKEIVVEEENTTEEGEEAAEEKGEEENDKNDDEKDKKDDKKSKKAGKKISNIANPVLKWIVEHKKLCIGCGIGLIVLILVLVWAFGIAPAAIVSVEIRTTKSPFSQNVSFTETMTDENTTEGKFYIEQKKLETKVETKFEATGEKNIGEKAKGQMVVYAYFATKGTVSISTGTEFRLDDLAYTADEGINLTWDGSLTSCENYKNDNDPVIVDGGISCLKSGIVNVTAMNSGEKYNIAASSAGWSNTARVSSYNREAMSGGTDKIITIVQQSDIDKAISELNSDNNNTSKINKDKLFDEIPDTSFIIEPSYKQTVGEAVSTPKVGEEVKEGAKATLSVVTTDTVYFIDKTKMEEFIKEKAQLAENYKIYNIEDPFIENFIKVEGGYTGKLKTSFISGPEVTENDIIEVVKGKGVGSAQHDLSGIAGMGKINITTSYPWVRSIPNDPNKITVIIDVDVKTEE